MSQLGSLLLSQFPELQPAPPPFNKRSECVSVINDFAIIHGLGWYSGHMKASTGYEDIYFCRVFHLPFSGHIFERQAAPAYVFDLAQFRKARPEDGERQVLRQVPLEFPFFSFHSLTLLP